jgi:diacylglycerol O-acyltransferase / wax synthase
MTVREQSPRQPPRLWREFALGLAVFGLYVLIETFSTQAREIAALRHGEQILAFERALHIDLETPLNEWLARHTTLQVFANYEYAITYIVSALWLLIWLYRKRPDVYRWARNSFVILNLIAFAGFVWYPTAPPRLIAGEGFYDTVLHGHTWFSWGSPLVSSANQLAAMPSLHLAWALWVSVVLACISSSRWVQSGSALHVLVTLLVILATANHYLLDAVAAAVVIWLALAVMSIFQDRPGQRAQPRVDPADAFFLHAESTAYPQHVGGVIVQDYHGPGDLYREHLRDKIEEKLFELPRFTQLLWWRSRWSRPRWTSADDLDWDWHVPHHDLSRPDGSPGGWHALWREIAALQSKPMPRDRPMWRWLTVSGFAEGKIAAVILVHHAFADGIGTVAQAIRTFEPLPDMEIPPHVELGPIRRAGGIALGLAQLATDGRAHGELPNGDGSGERRFGGLSIPVSRLRAIAMRHHTRVTDVLLTAVAVATQETLGARPTPRRFRVAVPLMVRTPESTREGNHTAAVITDVPLGARPDTERLAEVGRHTRRLRSGARALASRFVISTGIALLPQPAQSWFTRTVYGHRFFQAIVSNMPGPAGRHHLVGGLVTHVFPIVPLANGAPLVVGGLSWSRVLNLGISADPAFMGDEPAGMDAFIDAIGATLDRLEAAEVSPVAEAPAPRATETTRSGA